MELLTRTVYSGILLSLFLAVASALETQVLSTVVFTRHGERTPLIWDSSPVLTTLGAQQLYDAGAWFRSQYISPPNNFDAPGTIIRDMSEYLMINTELNIISTNDAYVAGSAQAFMQGLYPPLVENGSLTYMDGASILANGSVVDGPQQGMQFALVRPLSTNDVNSIWVGGMNNCPALIAAQMEYFNTSQYQAILEGSQSFYNSLSEDILNGVFPDGTVGYLNAYTIADYLAYTYAHNNTVAQDLDPTDLETAQILADDWVFAMYANASSDGSVAPDHLEAIAGRTFANRVMRMFSNSISSGGQYNKMNLMFGDFEPMVSFAALAGLMTPQNAAFYSVPAVGSSFIFELFSMTSGIGDYPSTSDMYVRFLYRNSSDQYSSLVEYSLFGSSPSQAIMSLTDFTNSMSRIMINNAEDWCITCQSDAIFCPYFEDNGSSTSSSNGSSHLSPVIAGVIGALVTLAVALLLIAALMLFGGMRTYRVYHKRRSDLGGFKGAEKLASDQDLTLPKGGAGATIVETNAGNNKGHERVGSWELGEQAKDVEAHPGLDIKSNISNRPSFEEDDIHVSPYATPVKPKDQL